MISQRQSDGTKKIVEKSWFNRGNMIVVMGVLIALLAPAYARHVEKSRETVDIANVRSA